MCAVVVVGGGSKVGRGGSAANGQGAVVWCSPVHWCCDVMCCAGVAQCWEVEQACDCERACACPVLVGVSVSWQRGRGKRFSLSPSPFSLPLPLHCLLTLFSSLLSHSPTHPQPLSVSHFGSLSYYTNSRTLALSHSRSQPVSQPVRSSQSQPASPNAEKSKEIQMRPIQPPKTMH